MGIAGIVQFALLQFRAVLELLLLFCFAYRKFCDNPFDSNQCFGSRYALFRIDLARLNPDTDLYWKCGSESRIKKTYQN
jgi:hypothetical protein